MSRLTLQDVLTATATPFPKFQSLRRRNQIGLAFGRSVAAASLSYVAADCVGLMLVDVLAQSYPNAFAATLTRVHFDGWGYTLAEAEAHPDHDASFCVVDLERESDGQKAHFVAGAADLVNPQALAAELLESTPGARGYVAVRVNCINISRLVRFIRKTAAANGIDLSAAFLPPPDSHAYRDLMRPYVELRDQAIIEVKNRKKREAVAAKIGEKARSAFEALMREGPSHLRQRGRARRPAATGRAW
ncbi:hypothetical protein [Bradyrhizobium sp. RDI18]|uniref:hypothetical protein n=1 Tax=Bradyrhizobium sp. RDI18 TaxID=3367400 RepID=UPI0037193131